MRKPNFDDYLALCSGIGSTNYIGLFKTKEETAQVADSEKLGTNINYQHDQNRNRARSPIQFAEVRL